MWGDWWYGWRRLDPALLLIVIRVLWHPNKQNRDHRSRGGGGGLSVVVVQSVHRSLGRLGQFRILLRRHQVPASAISVGSVPIPEITSECPRALSLCRMSRSTDEAMAPHVCRPLGMICSEWAPTLTSPFCWFTPFMLILVVKRTVGGSLG